MRGRGVGVHTRSSERAARRAKDSLAHARARVFQDALRARAGGAVSHHATHWVIAWMDGGVLRLHRLSVDAHV